MEKVVCRIHVLKRFTAFEWALLISILNSIAIDQNLLLKHGLIFIVAPVLLMAIISDLFFYKEKYFNYENLEVEKLRARRYLDLVLYVILMFLSGLYSLLGVVLFIIVLVAFDLNWLVGLISAFIFFIIPVLAVLVWAQDISKKPSKYLNLLFKLSVPYDFMKRRIEELHCAKGTS